MKQAAIESLFSCNFLWRQFFSVHNVDKAMFLATARVFCSLVFSYGDVYFNGRMKFFHILAAHYGVHFQIHFLDSHKEAGVHGFVMKCTLQGVLQSFIPLLYLSLTGLSPAAEY